jgi:hypothetical protein
MKRMVLAKKKSSGKSLSIKARRQSHRLVGFVVCIDNKGYPASLERNKIYPLLKDERAAEDGFIRIIDESGEDYLYAKKRFAAVTVPNIVKASIRKSVAA